MARLGQVGKDIADELEAINLRARGCLTLSTNEVESREDKIAKCIANFTGRKTKKGWPYVRDLRRSCEIKDITTSERNKICKKTIISV